MGTLWMSSELSSLDELLKLTEMKELEESSCAGFTSKVGMFIVRNIIYT
jgi:hypothetical protein